MLILGHQDLEPTQPIIILFRYLHYRRLHMVHFAKTEHIWIHEVVFAILNVLSLLSVQLVDCTLD